EPVRNDREAGERGRVKLLEEDPVADHVLDGVGHHHRGDPDEEQAEPRLAQGGERARRAHGRGVGPYVAGKGRWPDATSCAAPPAALRWRSIRPRAGSAPNARAAAR